jgi:hypothetical protein
VTNGRAKGAVAEREIAKLFEDWWQPVEPGCVFKRTPMSGGWASPEARGDFGTAGDLVTTARRFPFAVEVKRREGWNLERLWSGRPSPVWKWWAQARAAAAEMQHKTPLLLMRQSHMDWLAMVPLSFMYTALPQQPTVNRSTAVCFHWVPGDLKRVDYGRFPVNDLPCCAWLGYILSQNAAWYAIGG